jgi:hypothetical protein
VHMTYKRIPVTEDLLKMEEDFKRWSGEKTAAKAYIWALEFAHKYKTLEEGLEKRG